MLTTKIQKELSQALSISTKIKNSYGHSPFLSRFRSTQDLLNLVKYGEINENGNLSAVINGQKVVLTVDNYCPPCNMNVNRLTVFKVNLKDDSLFLEISHLGNSIEVSINLISKLVALTGDQFKDQQIWNGIPHNQRVWNYSYKPAKRPIVRKA
jgi:hypothetical protein